ncbi:hypothetical protein [Halobacteriovorax sp. JY17]|uniref:hypothetical protein n=1 Tax=Halobacteriovorax sp. JY17 TaxID=2014617 RepID=UPI000C3835AF|nr:hypothetical protein [Halobacteriovorax sp. JY17]PIK15470.1 MAG: hypothetical protein CES88_01760 [Halobacteriovorax sp. JY17]
MFEARFLFIFIFSLAIQSNCFGEETSVDLSGSLKEAYKTLREIRDAGGFELVEVPEEKERDFNICVSCSEVSSLVKEVNKALMVLAEDEDRKDPSKRTVEKVSGLDALYHYTYDDRAPFSRAKCTRYLDENSMKSDIDLSDSKVLFSNEIPIGSLNALIIRDGIKRTYFYRGKEEDRETIIRLDIHGDEKAKITYYKVKEAKILNVSDKKEVKPPKKTTEKWEVWSGSEPEGVSQKSEHLNYGVGFSVEHRNRLPKKLTLVKGSSMTSVGNLFAVKTDTEISSKKQTAAVAISSTKGEDFARLELDKDVLELKVPARIDLLDSGLKLETEYSINSKDEQKLSFVLNGEKGASTSLVFERDELRGNSGSLNRNQRISEGQTISLQLKGREDGQNEAWLRYSLAF